MLINFGIIGGNVLLGLAGRQLYYALQSPDINGTNRILFAKAMKRNYQARRAENYLMTKQNEGKYGVVVERNFVDFPLQSWEIRGEDDVRIKRIYNTLRESNPAFGFFVAEGIQIRFFYVVTQAPDMFSFGDGTIVVDKEYLKRKADGTPAYTDSIIAVAMAHELAHVLLEHDVQRSAARTFGTLCTAIAAVSIPAVGMGIFPPASLGFYGAAQFVITFGSLNMYLDWNRARRAEDEADDLGMRWALSAHFDIREAFGFMVQLFEDYPKSTTTRFFDAHRSMLDRSLHFDELITKILDGSPILAQALPEVDPRVDSRATLDRLVKAAK